MEGQAGSSDPSFSRRTSERIGKWATMASSGSTEAEPREGLASGLPYAHADPRASAYGYDAHLQRPTPYSRISIASQPGAATYYDQSGYHQAGASMATYDPTQVASHTSNSSRSSNMEQSISPLQAPFYSSPLLTNVQQSHMGAYPTSYSHYQQQQQPSALHIDTAPPGFQLVRSMNGSEMSSVGAMMDPHVDPHAVSSPMSPLGSSSQHDNGFSMNSGSVYYRQYPSQAATQYTSQQAYYPNAMSVSGPNPNAGYPAMMQGSYSQAQQQQQQQQQHQQQQYSSTSYGVYPTQYVATSYPSQQQSSTAYYASSRPCWNPSQQQWRPPYYSHQSLPAASSGFRRTSRGGSNNRSKAFSNSTLPVRPGGVPLPVRSSSGATSADASVGPMESHRDMSMEGSDLRASGRAMRFDNQPQQGLRSDHVLWCGNVPSDATVEELWSFFSRLPADEEREGDDEDLQIVEGQENDPAMSPHSGHGVLSIFIIARSNCAFVNYASPRHLERAVMHFHGQSLRPFDSRCPKLVCRVRKKDDEAQAGVAGQRGRGIHVAWVKEQDRKMKQEKKRSLSNDKQQQQQVYEASVASTPVLPSDHALSNSEASGRPPLTSSDLNTLTSSSTEEPSISQLLQNSSKAADPKILNSGISIDSSSGSISFTSTSSSLFRHPAFQERFFILKSLSVEDLDRSVQNGVWATQPHNEQVLDQAFRNSEAVYLIFSANQSGGFYGYARMASAILTAAERQQQQQQSGNEGVSASLGDSPSKRVNASRPDAIPEGDEAKQDREDVSPPSVRAAAAASSMLGVPQDTDPSRDTIASPLPLTPAEEGLGSSMPHAGSPPDMSQALADLDREWSQMTVPPSDALLSRSSTVVPSLTTTAPSGVVVSADGDVSPSLSSSHSAIATIMTKVPVAMDENGIRRKDMIVDAIVNTKDGSIVAPLSNESYTLGPSDSVSYDSKTQQQLALRALIHNLRLEQRESQVQAENLEKAMNDPSQVGTILEASDSPPKAGSPEAFGRPFKIDWIKTSPLSFSHVRKLRNPWRDNRQVKVSRDGTELEPNTGRQLLKEWQRLEEDSAGLAAAVASVRLAADEEDEDDDAAP